MLIGVVPFYVFSHSNGGGGGSVTGFAVLIIFFCVLYLFYLLHCLFERSHAMSERKYKVSYTTEEEFIKENPFNKRSHFLKCLLIPFYTWFVALVGLFKD